MLKIKKYNKKIANVGVAPLGDPQTKNISNKCIANAVGANDPVRPHLQELTIKTPKAYSNLISNLQPLTSKTGITLIALIITIIVMLILVGVTISVTLNGGLFEKAKTATIQTEEEKILEEMLAMAEITDEGKFDYNTIINKIKSNHPEYTIEYTYPNATITGKLGTYKYIVSENEIRKGIKKIPTVDDEFEKYILGQQKTGRPLMEIVDEDSGIFIDDPLTNDVDETETLGVESLNISYGLNEEDMKLFMYVKYDDKAYKIVINLSIVNDDISIENTERLELVYVPKGNEGREIADGWTILYDNGATVEAVSPTAMGELRLGYSEGAIGIEQKTTEVIESYNNAISTINEYCYSLKDLPEHSKVRSVGGSSETNEYYNKIPSEWKTGEYNGKVKLGDMLYEQDIVRMSYWGKNNVGGRYWVASRYSSADPSNNDSVAFGVGSVEESGLYSLTCLFALTTDKCDWDQSTGSMSVRPIITVNNIES